ncbi:tetratricopeptide repeat protein [Nitrosomonas marina]|uniref:Sel1 repeat-containing protein n=1 Tax=Nitrosomonas marina TaxID=917 RepID=A0A1H8CLE5_9PROT|nr:tetratricopeptide repeat protein [Nitrosomonas marina]SEM95752.1 Sel1 repeat-containing protein [Nitrosomonas marina]
MSQQKQFKPLIVMVTFSVTCGLLTACATSPRYTGYDRVCDSSGCYDRPMQTVQYQSASDPVMTDEQHQAAALIAMAEDDPVAAYDLALRYFRGDGIKRNSYQAIQWMRNAADRGNLDAQKALGRLYLTGLEEMGPDFREAEKWLSLAAAAGDKESEELLTEATRLKHTERQYYLWSNRWRPIFQRSWYSNYPYHYQWRNNGWRYY